MDAVGGTFNSKSLSGYSNGFSPTASESVSMMIDGVMSNFKTKTNSNVVAISSITLFIADNVNRKNWEAVKKSISIKYNAPVRIVVDPKKLAINTQGGMPISSTTTRIEVNMSGVKDGNLNYAASGAH